MSPGSVDSDEEESGFVYRYHPKLTAQPVNEDGFFLPPHAPPPADPPVVDDAASADVWDPFQDRIGFAYYHFVEVQNSEKKIDQALNHWAATIIESGESAHWDSTAELYATIDRIKHGDAPWKLYKLRYRGALPQGVPPRWMTQTYEFCTRNIRDVIHNQLATVQFAHEVNYVPYRQFDVHGGRIWSNLMSGDWAWSQADQIAQNPTTCGAMFCPIVIGSDKTTTSVATGHQEFHPVYVSAGILTNTARRGHGNGVLPVAFLPIPKANRRQRGTTSFQKFQRQMYHACLARVFMPLKAAMTTPEVVRCPDGHFRRVVYGIGPYIADYPEQIWLSAVVQNWCPKCDAKPDTLDAGGALRRSHRKTDHLKAIFAIGVLWNDYGIRSDVVPFTHGFPRADIHELLTPDLLHQLIKGTFKDHLVAWVNEYLVNKHGEARGQQIIDEIDRRIAAVPAFPGLRRFPEGRDFKQWTGDDSKALMKIYLPAISGHVPPEILQAFHAFLDFCYIARRNAIDVSALQAMRLALERFHRHRQIFIAEGVRDDISLPRQHSMMHYIQSVRLFGSPNGLCSSITESKHIKAVKEPWRRSSRHNSLDQMLTTNQRLDKLQAARARFEKLGMLAGTTLTYTARMLAGGKPEPLPDTVYMGELDYDQQDDHGSRSLSSVELARTPERGYPNFLPDLAQHIGEPKLTELVRRFLWEHDNVDDDESGDVDDVPLELCPNFVGHVRVFHSAVSRFYAPSDLSGAGGMYRERIRSHPNWRGQGHRRDTVFIQTSVEDAALFGMTIGRVLLFFSLTHGDSYLPLALVHWFVPIANQPDPLTGMWIVQPEFTGNGRSSLAVVHVDSIARSAHLIPTYGSSSVPEGFHFSWTLDAFRAFYVNPYADHHTNEFLSK